MTAEEAFRILGLSPKATPQEIKKKYRALIMQIHPDADTHARLSNPHSANGTANHKKYAYSAQELNTAYAVLKNRSDGQTQKRTRREKEQRTVWNAPVNRNAYTAREILQTVEDYDGEILGNYCIARGKYLWTIDEDFSLFLFSLYRCSKQLLDEKDAMLSREEPPANRQLFQAELTYFLAQQFISQTALLEVLTKEETPDSDGNRIFYVPAMLETPGKTLPLKPGEALYPFQIKRHRLYLKNQAGQAAGYLSFHDDRLYYVVIPLFEQKAVQIKIQADEKQPERRSFAAYQNLHLWLRLSGKACKHLPENLNLQIAQLLEKY